MKISVLRESKTDSIGRVTENRVIFTPPLVAKLIHSLPNAAVVVEAHAGKRIRIEDKEYEKAGARMVSHTESLRADLVLGVKETHYPDFNNLSKNIVMSFQHFAASEDRAKRAKKSGATFICLETIQTEKNGKPYFPCLAPMSEAAGRIIVRHADFYALMKMKIISSGLGENPSRLKVLILGAGNVGATAAAEFSARGMEVHLLDRNSVEKLPHAIEGAFFAVSAMYTSGCCPEKRITKELLKKMVPGGCVYPVDIDQGCGIEGVRETSILDPFNLPKIKDTEIYYFAPPNIPSLGAATASPALGEAVLPYVIEIAEKGLLRAAEENPAIKAGINIQNGEIIHPGLAKAIV